MTRRTTGDAKDFLGCERALTAEDAEDAEENQHTICWFPPRPPRPLRFKRRAPRVLCGSTESSSRCVLRGDSKRSIMRLPKLLRCSAAIALAATSALAQPPRPNVNARPVNIPATGAVPRESAAEAKLREEVKAPEGFNTTLFAGPPVAMYPTCLADAPDGAIFVCV